MQIRSNLPVPVRSSLVRRPSNNRPIYPAQSFADTQIAPIDGVRGGAVHEGRNFAAQLLELGLRHQVEGLVNKASDQLAATTTTAPTPHDHYEAAQQNFSDPHLLRWYV